MANGRVLTGFSKPYVALYANTGTTVTYSSCTPLARGVNVKVEAEDAGDSNNFYADNTIAETVAGAFGGGTATLTVDGVKDAVKKLILGLPDADADGFVHYGSDMNTPYVGIGFVARYQEEGVVSYVPYILTKAKFAVPADNANSQEEDIEWQTEELVATLMRDDTATADWKLIGGAQTTEALAVSKIITKLGGTVS